MLWVRGNGKANGSYWGLGFGDIILPIMENEMEKNMENKLEIRIRG